MRTNSGRTWPTMFNRLGGVIRGVDSEAAAAPRVAVTALEATGVA